MQGPLTPLLFSNGRILAVVLGELCYSHPDKKGSKSHVEPLGRRSKGDIKKAKGANARAKDPMPEQVEKENKGKCHKRETKQVVKQRCTSKQDTMQVRQGAKPSKHTRKHAIQVIQDRKKKCKRVHHAKSKAKQVVKSRLDLTSSQLEKDWVQAIFWESSPGRSLVKGKASRPGHTQPQN